MENPKEIKKLWNKRVKEKTGRNADEFLLLCRIFGCDFQHLAKFLSLPDVFRSSFVQKDVSAEDCRKLFSEASLSSPEAYAANLGTGVEEPLDDPYERIRLAELALLQDKLFHFNSALKTGLPGRNRLWAVDSLTVRKMFRHDFFEPAGDSGKFRLSKKGKSAAEASLRFVRTMGPGFGKGLAILKQEELWGPNAS